MTFLILLDHILGLDTSPMPELCGMDYDIKVFDDPNEMRELLREKNKPANKARMLAGYCYEWRSRRKENKEIYDIQLKNGFRAKWNFDNDNVKIKR